ncbi:MAG: response regulator transcription factor [Bacteroidales bacterium]
MEQKILLVDDHQAVLAGVKKELTKYYNPGSIITHSNIPELYLQLKSSPAKLLLLDYEVGKYNALEILDNIHKYQPNLPVLIYTMHTESWIILMLIKAQINGIVIKGDPIEDVLTATRTILEKNEKYYSKYIHNLLFSLKGDEYYSKSIEYHPSQREMQIITLISKGNTSEDISKKLFLSKNTVETLRKNIINKSEATNTANLIRIAFIKGWITE